MGELCASGHDVIDKNECQIATDTLKPNDGVIVNQMYRNEYPPFCVMYPNFEIWWNTHPTLVGDVRANYYTSLCRVEKTVTVTENVTKLCLLTGWLQRLHVPRHMQTTSAKLRERLV